MHDAIIGERLGLPAAAILTSAFVSAGDLMARVLGAKDYRFAVTAHPISSASAAELETQARRAVEDCVALLLAAQS